MSDLSISRARAFNKEINTAHPYLHISTWLVSLKIDSSEKDLSRLPWQFRSSDKISFNTSHLSFSLTHSYVDTLQALFYCPYVTFPTHTSTVSLMLSVIISLSRLKFQLSVAYVFNDHKFWVVHSLEMTFMLILSVIIDSINVLSIYYPISIWNRKH